MCTRTIVFVQFLCLLPDAGPNTLAGLTVEITFYLWNFQVLLLLHYFRVFGHHPFYPPKSHFRFRFSSSHCTRSWLRRAVVSHNERDKHDIANVRTLNISLLHVGRTHYQMKTEYRSSVTAIIFRMWARICVSASWSITKISDTLHT